MNRRQFNQTMAALSAITTMPAFACLTAATAECEIEHEKSSTRVGQVTSLGEVKSEVQHLK